MYLANRNKIMFERTAYAVLTNFSLFKGNSETHPWMGLDRYAAAENVLKVADTEIAAGGGQNLSKIEDIYEV